MLFSFQYVNLIRKEVSEHNLTSAYEHCNHVTTSKGNIQGLVHH